MTSRSWRTATIAASLTRLARSAPEKPGVPRETAVRSTSAARCLLRAWVARMAVRSAEQAALHHGEGRHGRRLKKDPQGDL